ncbi:helix-turn-helix transcriptional regulator [Arthrobacter sp. P2b]|uniref:helix-turn-helix transcriptional regulator n=1 Tax=Arthrobacter sp. P2b TaxID=1938741 RepID=UPI0009A6FA6D|nr:LuxR C-terminal-related transcriptional regulator [Arthrobacter sp. P2b]SLK10509.1 GAF domain-containing protein [Arthrobacter sp. P2b]
MTTLTESPLRQLSTAADREPNAPVWMLSDGEIIEHVRFRLSEGRHHDLVSGTEAYLESEALITALVKGNLESSRVAEAADLLLRLVTQGREVAKTRGGVNPATLRHLHAVSSALGTMGNEDAMTKAAGLCHKVGFAKVLISAVSGSDWVPIAYSISPELLEDFRNLGEFLQGAKFSLLAADREAEMVRLQRPFMVNGADLSHRTFPPLLELSRPAGYVAAPLVSQGRVIGMLHADRHDDPVRESDMKILALLSEQIMVAREKMELAKRGRDCSRRSIQLLNSLTAILENTPGKSQEAAGTYSAHRVPAPHFGPVWGGRSRDHWGLTRREREVLQELTTGATNSTIARHLSVSEETVKSHVKSVLDKLGATTRAEASARFLQNHPSPESPRS